MPNHITTIIEIKDTNGMKMEDIAAVFLNNDGDFDFNKIIPMPECLENFNPHSIITTTAEAIIEAPISGNTLLALMELQNRKEALEKYNNNEVSHEDKKAIERAIKNYKECGFIYWYDWTNTNWGTKWNAYGQSRDGNIFRFETAWNHPDKIIKIVSERLIGVTIDVKYADDDIGSNCGTYSIKNGGRIKENISPNYRDMTPHDKIEFSKLAFRIIYGDKIDPRSHGYNDNWEYSDEVYEKYELEQKKAK